MGRKRKSRRGKRAQGFSRPGQGQAWGLITRGAGIKGGEKRRFFNQLSGIMVLSAAVAGALFGYSLLGWLGGIIGLIVGAALMGKLVIRGRYFR